MASQHPPGVPNHAAFQAPYALPPGWTEQQTPYGEIYYYNVHTGQSTWARPTMLHATNPVMPQPTTHGAAAAAAPSSAASQPPEKTTSKKKTRKPIPDTDWFIVRTADGLEFYYNKSTKQSVWEVPEEIKEAVEKVKKEVQEEQETQRNGNKRKLEEENENDADVKRQKPSDDQQEATEMTEEDIMWQLQTMDPEEMAELGLNANEIQTETAAAPATTEQSKETSSETTTTPTTTAAAAAAAEHPELSEEERIERFTQMLSEKNIQPFSTWEKELPKFINDPRYTLLPPNKRKNLFNNFCRVLAEEQKAKKAMEKTPEEEFQSLLEEQATAKMYWEDFRRKAREDRRFKAIKEVKVREKMFKEYVKRLRKEQEKQGTSQQQKEADYIKLLKETREIQPGMRWRDAKLLLEKDPRYHAIESKTLREDLFRDFLEDLQKERR